MKFRLIAVTCLLNLTLTLVAHATDKPTLASVLDRQLTGVEKELVPAAEAIPADKFGFAPGRESLRAFVTSAPSSSMSLPSTT